MISRFKRLQTHFFSHEFRTEPDTFTKFSKKPAEIKLTLSDNGVYAIDKDEESDSTILSELGNIMELMFTTPKAEFQSLFKDQPRSAPMARGAFQYVKTGDLVLRAQLDCQHPQLPRKVFDLKTRATIPIRLDVDNYQNYLNYHLKKPTGLFESFEREYYDMVRSAFLKFSLQARIGKMDGIMVAFHNTSEVFGFQYVPLAEMDFCVFGSSQFAQASFNLATTIFNDILLLASERFPGRDLKITFQSELETSDMNVYISPYRKQEEVITNGDGDLYSPPGGQPERYFTLRFSATSKINNAPVHTPGLRDNSRDSWELSYSYRTFQVPTADYNTMMEAATTKDYSDKLMDLLRSFCASPVK